MKDLIVAAMSASLLLGPAAFAAEKGQKVDAAHVRKDIADHRTLALRPGI